jgi:arylsulfatase A-like enzyme
MVLPSRLFVLLAFVGAASCAWGQTATSSSAKSGQPDIVFVLTDDMGYSDPGCYGGTFVPTPNIDELAREGTRFTHFYDAAPVCSPSRAGFITGIFPARLNFTSYLNTRARNRDSEQTDFLTTAAPALARVLKAAGYATAHFGKWHLGGGRDVKDAPLFSAYGYDEHVGTWESPEPDPQITASDWIWSAQDPVKRWDRTRYFVDHALDFLSRHKNQPCYVEVWPDDVHTPWVPNLQREMAEPKSEEEPDFCAVLAQYDVQMGRLFNGIDALGLAKNTIIIFTSDNGPLPTFNHARTGGLRGSKVSLYEGGVRVPFIVRWPDHVPANRVDEQTVISGVDLFPTLCTIGQATLPSGVNFDGQDMSAAWTAAPLVRAKTIFWEYGRNSVSFNYPKDPYDRSPHLAVREGKWKLLVNPDGTNVELYDLEADPNETTNLVSRQPDVGKKLCDDALTWRRALPTLQNPLFPDNAPAIP